MEDIRCPHCGKFFQVDETGYADIAKQVRDKEFHKELEERAKLLKESQAKDAEILQANADKKLNEALAEKDKEIAGLKAQIDKNESEMQLAIEKERSQAEKNEAELDKKISELEAKLDKSDTELQLAVEKERSQAEKDGAEMAKKISELESQRELDKQKAALEQKTLKDTYELQLRLKDDEIATYKEFKLQQSTKMIGESLEQHCLNEFEKVHAMFFPTASFGKDNEVKDGTKGDFVFRDFEDGTEYISIMFEMKNEADDTQKKQKNEQFFAKLDKDRNAKGCEYAILVSMLESDSELYNTGIVDVSHKYPKMYVIRPQFFLQIISILCNASKNAAQYKKQLALAQAQNIDITNFENQLETFKHQFGYNYGQASKRFQAAIKEIDDAIESLQKVRSDLVGSEDQLRRTNEKIEGLTIKKLTWKNPTMKAKFEEARKMQDITGIEDMSGEAFGSDDDGGPSD